MSTAGPLISIVIPVYNEEEILRDAVQELAAGLLAQQWTWELLLAENGSIDQTREIGAALASEYSQVDMFSVSEPNYGAALRAGLERARGKYCICDEIDLCDLGFYQRALELLERDAADMVVGSKAMLGAADQRPLLRRVATRTINGMLRVTTGFRGTDTHGLKAFHRYRLAPVIDACRIERDLFASELVIRASRSDLRVTEVPVVVAEKRRPSINLLRRVPRVLGDLARLTYAIHRKD